MTRPAKLLPRVVHDVERPSSSVVERFGNIWAATVCDVMARDGAMSPQIRPISTDTHVVGTALTVKCFPGDNISVHKAIQMAQPGDVLVIDAGGAANVAMLGHNMALAAMRQGIAGAVTDGAIRDLALLQRERFPVFCSGVTPRSAQKHTPGPINVEVEVGGLVVLPGDIVIGDGDGVAVVPRLAAEEVADAVERAQEMEAQQADDIRSGAAPLEILAGENWLDESLNGKVTEVRHA